MTDQPELYSGLSGGRVLDVGTGRGGFVHELMSELADYDEIIGIDVDEGLADDFAQRVGDDPRVRFEPVNVMTMPYQNHAFDTVSVAGSLHHLSDPRAALREMLRVLRPGGRLIVAEMYRDGQTAAQLTHVMLHHWWASVDRLRDTVHRETYTRAEVVDLVNGLELSGLTMRDYAYLDSDPFEPTQLARQASSIDQYSDIAAGHPDLIAQGAVIRRRLDDVGFHLATVLVAMGEKRLDH